MSDSVQVPDGWDDKCIRDLVKFIGGSQPPRDTFVFKPKEGYVRLLQIRDYKTDKYKTYISESLSKRYCTADDIMIGRYGPPIFQILRGKEGSYNVALIKANPNSDSLRKDYLYFFLCRDDLFQMIEGYSQRTSGQTGIDMDALNDFRFPLPPLPEQKKITSILTSVDDVIEKTEAQISKLQDLKKGMMTELLTKGIGHTEFKDSPVGRIPVSWEVSKLKEKCKRITDGTHQSVKVSKAGVIPFLYVSCIKDGKILWDKSATITEKEYEVASKGRKPTKGDLLYTAVGSYGHAVVVEEDRKFSFQRHIAFIQPIKDVLLPEYLCWYLNSPMGKKQADRLAVGNAQLTVTLGDLGNFIIPIASFKEQKKIVEHLNSIEQSIIAVEFKLLQTKSLKKALMNDLLTGKVRVSITN